MKIRNGFVSNSSSSSFCIYGVEFNDKQLDAMLEKLELEANWRKGDVIANALDLDYERGQYDETYIGLSPYSIDKNKSLNEIEKEIQESFKKAGVENVSCSFEHDGWYEG